MSTIGIEEESLLMNDRFYLLKQSLSKKMVELLGVCAESLRVELENNPGLLPAEVLRSTAKISKGENYLGRPWTILDYPRVFGQTDLFAFRTLCWWGQGFSMTLLLKGKYLDTLLPNLCRNAKKIADAGFHIGIADDPFVHHFALDNILPLNQFSEAGQCMLTQVDKSGFLKLVRLLPLSENRRLAAETVNSWRILSAAF